MDTQLLLQPFVENFTFPVLNYLFIFVKNQLDIYM